MARRMPSRALGGCAAAVGHIAGDLQHQQHQRDGDRRGHFLRQGDQAVEHALVALAGLPFVPFDGVRDDRPGQHMRRADADAGQHAQAPDQRQRGAGVQGDQDDLHDRPEGDPGDIGQALVPVPGGPLPEGQHEMAVTKMTAMIRSLCASRWTTYLMKYSSVVCRISIDTQVSRKMTMPKTKGRFLAAAFSDSRRPGCSSFEYSGRSRVPKKTSSSGRALASAKIAAHQQHPRRRSAGWNEPMIISGTVKAIRLPRMEKNMR